MRRGGTALLVLAAIAAPLSGVFYLLRPPAGPVLATVVLPAFPSQVVADERAGRVLVLSSHDPSGAIARGGTGGSVRLLDAADGLQLQTLRMGTPFASLMDPRTGRAFVVSSGVPSTLRLGGGMYLQIIDPARGVLVRTITLVAPAPLPAPPFPTFTPVAPVARTIAPATPFAATSPQPGGSDSPAAPDARSRGQMSGRAMVPPRTPLPGGSSQPLGTNGGGFSEGGTGLGLAIDVPSRRLFVLTNAAVGPGFSSRLDVVNADSGALLRSVPLPIAAGALAVDGRAGRLFVTDSTAQGIRVYDARTLRRLTVFPLAGCSPVQVAVDEAASRAYALCSGAASGLVITLDSSSGHRLNAATTGANGMQLLVDSARGRVYAVSAGSFVAGRPGAARIAVLDAHSGALLRSITLGSIIPQVALDPVRGRLYVAGSDPRTNRGMLLVLDAASGSVRARLAVGRGTTGLAVDTRRGRLFVAGASGLVPEAGRWGSLVDRVRTFFGQQTTAPATSQPGIDGPGGAITVLDAAL